MRPPLSPGETSLTYGELNLRANTLARRLASLGFAEGSIAAVGLPRGPGGDCLLPCHPQGGRRLSSDRFTRPGGSHFLPPSPGGSPDRSDEFESRGEPACLCSLTSKFVSSTNPSPANEGDLSISVSANSPAYILFTSGSTGSSKRRHRSPPRRFPPCFWSSGRSTGQFGGPSAPRAAEFRRLDLRNLGRSASWREARRFLRGSSRLSVPWGNDSQARDHNDLADLQPVQPDHRHQPGNSPRSASDPYRRRSIVTEPCSQGPGPYSRHTDRQRIRPDGNHDFRDPLPSARETSTKHSKAVPIGRPIAGTQAYVLKPPVPIGAWRDAQRKPGREYAL